MQELQLVLCKEFILYNPFELYTLPSLHCNNNMKALALQANVAHFFKIIRIFFVYSSKFPSDFMTVFSAPASEEFKGRLPTAPNSITASS